MREHDNEDGRKHRKPDHRGRGQGRRGTIGDQFADVLSAVDVVPTTHAKPAPARGKPAGEKRESTPRPPQSQSEARPSSSPRHYSLRYNDVADRLHDWWKRYEPEAGQDEKPIRHVLSFKRLVRATVFEYKGSGNINWILQVNHGPADAERPQWVQVASGEYKVAGADNVMLAKMASQIAWDYFVRSEFTDKT